MSDYKKIASLLFCLSLFSYLSFGQAPIPITIAEDFENGDPFENGNASTDYSLTGTDHFHCNENKYWISDDMHDGCPYFPWFQGDGNFMTINEGGSLNPRTIWQKTVSSLEGVTEFSIDVKHRTAQGGSYGATINVEVLANDELVQTFTIEKKNEWETKNFWFFLPKNTNTLEIRLNGSGSSDDFAIDNILFESQQCILDPSFTYSTQFEGGELIFNLTANTYNENNRWDIYKAVSCSNGVGDSNLEWPALITSVTFDGSGNSLSLSIPITPDLNSGCYVIKHGIVNDICSWTENRQIFYITIPICNPVAPTGLNCQAEQQSGPLTFPAQFYWNEVPNASGYVVSIGESMCKCLESIDGVNTYTVNSNTFSLPNSLKDKCFSWTVRTICNDGQMSPWAASICYKGPQSCGGLTIGGGDSPTGGHNRNNSTAIYPNPNNGDFNIELSSNKSTPINIQLYDLKGTLIYTYSESKTEKGSFFKTISVEKDGLYVLSIITDEIHLTRKIVVKN